MSAPCPVDLPRDTGHRPVRSFVLREGRMTDGQRRAFGRLWPRFGLDPAPDETLDPAAVFGNGHPTRLEIGFGNGEALVALATAHPQCNFLGVEVHRPGVGRLLLALERERITNVRGLRRDAVELLHRGLPAASLEGVYLLFPDPWPKQRHHKRRIVQPAFLADLTRVLCPGGFVHMATDWQDYAQHMLSRLEATPGLVNTAGAGRFAPRPDGRPLTHFERRGQRLGHPVRDLLFRRT